MPEPIPYNGSVPIEAMKSIFEFPEFLIPQSIKDIAALCGEIVAVKLIIRFPGCYIFVPKEPLACNVLSDVLTHEEYALLCKQYYGHVSIPRAGRLIAYYRKQCIIREYMQRDKTGMLLSDIAIKYGTTVPYVSKAANHVAFSKQIDLFSIV